MRQDVKYAIRSLLRSPAFAVGAIATLALGIGVNSTIFSLTDSALFRSMPGIGASNELVWLSGVPRSSGRPGGMAYPEYQDFESRSREVFSTVLAFAPASFSLGSGGDPERIRGHFVSPSYFETLRVMVSAGRALSPSDSEPGANPVSIISDRLAKQRFGGRIPQQPIVINGRHVTVVGVTAPGFVGPELGQSADIWIPISDLPRLNTTQAGWISDRRVLWLRVMGRRRPGVSNQQAQAVVSGIAAMLATEHPDTNKDRVALVSDA